MRLIPYKSNNFGWIGGVRTRLTFGQVLDLYGEIKYNEFVIFSYTPSGSLPPQFFSNRINRNNTEINKKYKKSIRKARWLNTVNPEPVH